MSTASQQPGSRYQYAGSRCQGHDSPRRRDGRFYVLRSVELCKRFAAWLLGSLLPYSSIAANFGGMRRQQAGGKRFGLSLLLCFLAVAAALVLPQRGAYSQPAGMPQPAPLPSYSPLCDSNLVPCLDIDDFAGHAYAHLLILPKTDQRGTAVVIPYGAALGLFGRVAGGVSTSYSLWSQGDMLHRGHSPLRLSATLLLWPLFPLRPRFEGSREDNDGPHFTPPRQLRIGVTYDHELRVGPFEGANSLGFLTNLSTIRLVGAKALGPFELTLSLGALVDPLRQYATGEIAAQLGLYLPFFKALRVSVEAMGRGVPSFIHPDLVAALGEDALRRQGVLGLNLSYRPHARVDLGVSAQMGFGNLAPAAVIVRFMVLSVGRTYDGRTATPITALGADVSAYVAASVAARVKEYIASLPIDPKLDENCIIRDDDGSYMGRFGARSADRHYCEQDGFRVPIGHELLRDKAGDRLCRDSRKNPRTGKRDLHDCVLWRHGQEWLPAHQARLNEKCELRDSDGKFLGQVGTPSADGKHCRYPVTRDNGEYGRFTDYQEQPVGEILYTDAARSTACENPNLTRCFIKSADDRNSLKMTSGERFARGADRGLRNKAEGAQAAAQTVEDVATGKVKVTTIAEEVKKETAAVAKTITDPDKLKEVAKEKTDGWLKAATDWWNKPSDDKLDDAGEWTASAAVDGTVSLGMGAAGRLVGGVVDTAGDLRKLGKAGKTEQRIHHAQRPSGGAGPVRKGQHGVEKAKLRAEAQGKEIIGEEVSFDTTKGRRRVDLLTKDQQGQVEAVEVKTGKSRYTRRQQDKDHALDSEGGLPVGENARKAGLEGKVRIPTRLDRHE